MAETAEKSLQEYHGSCHCGLYKFSVLSSPISKVTLCNCSICSKNGYLWISSKRENYTVESGEDRLKEYWHSSKSHPHLFCPTCGSSVTYRSPDPDEVAINVRMLEDFNLLNLSIESFNGASLGSPYQAPQPPSRPSPQAGKVIYDGSCHCGAVTYTLQTPPITKAKTCDCSICRRNAYSWLYTSKQTLTIHGQSSLIRYSFGPKRAGHMFCSTCGVSMFNQFVQEELPLAPVNVRTVNGGEWGDVENLAEETRVVVAGKKRDEDGGEWWWELREEETVG